ncbi:MAG: DoxX family membrane protein [Bacteroidales bacterium]|nr:DoxX family membrane protein [Bacteroidales bacterium]
MKKYSAYLFTLLRILIGWHFLYEGISKLINPGWTAKYYLLGSKWIFAGVFHWMGSSEGVIKVVDFLNVWGLILIGISLFIGLLVRWSSIAGAVLLFFYFAAYPPIFGYTFGVVAEVIISGLTKTLLNL